MKEKLVIFGIGTFVSEIIYFIKKYELFDIVGFTVDKKYFVPTYDNLPVYPFEDLEKYVDKNSVKLFVAISVNNKFNKYKREKFEDLKNRGFRFANLISPLASINTNNIGQGNWICDFAFIGYNTTIGDNCVFLEHSLLAHHSKVDDHTFFAARATVAGLTNIGKNCYLGLSCNVFNKLNIGNFCLIGGGSNVKKDLNDFTNVVGSDSNIQKGSLKLNELLLSPQGVNFINYLNTSK